MNGAEDLVATLSSEGVAIPPTLGMQDAIQLQDRWQWGTHPCDRGELYRYHVDDVLAAVRENAELFMLSHGGHGINSYGLNLVIAKGPLAAYVQHSFGGVYSDPGRDREQIAATYSHLHQLWQQCAGIPGPPRWLLLHSNFRTIHALVDLPPVLAGAPWTSHREDFADEPSLFAAAADRFDRPESAHQ